jgi:hypothetical protein
MQLSALYQEYSYHLDKPLNTPHLAASPLQTMAKLSCKCYAPAITWVGTDDELAHVLTRFGAMAVDASIATLRFIVKLHARWRDLLSLH